MFNSTQSLWVQGFRFTYGDPYGLFLCPYPGSSTAPYEVTLSILCPQPGSTSAPEMIFTPVKDGTPMANDSMPSVPVSGSTPSVSSTPFTGNAVVPVSALVVSTSGPLLLNRALYTLVGCDRGEARTLLKNLGPGIYAFVNTVNGKGYIGSAQDLWTRLKTYWKPSTLSGRPRPIVSALVKYGFSAFTLVVLELADFSVVRRREEQLIDELRPEYNVRTKTEEYVPVKTTEELRKAASVAAFAREPRSAESRARQAASITGEGNHMFGVNLSEERKESVREAAFARAVPHKATKPVTVLDTTNGTSVTYLSNRAAATALRCDRARIVRDAAKGTLLDGRYKLTIHPLTSKRELEAMLRVEQKTSLDRT